MNTSNIGRTCTEPLLSFEYFIVVDVKTAEVYSYLQIDVNVDDGFAVYRQGMYGDGGWETKQSHRLNFFNEKDRRWLYTQIANHTMSIPTCTIQ